MPSSRRPEPDAFPETATRARQRRRRRALGLAWRALSLLSFSTLLAWAWNSAPPLLTRGPYQQNTSATGITLVCKTSAPAAVTLRFGERAGPPWQGETTSSSGTTHVFTLRDLRPETTYVYELASGGTTLAGGAGHAFRTAPPGQSRASFRFLAWGDSGTGLAPQYQAADWMERVLPAPEFALGLGDLVYEHGEWENYDPNLFRPYAELFARMTFWPTIGNHDYRTEQGAPYLDAFYLPKTSGAPGHPSNSELYYSFDHGMAHFACLDSESADSAPGSPMYAWLADDLDDARARGKRWLLAYMHHPPYSRGTHDSTAEPELIELHDNLVPLFEAKGVDMVLTGHSHVYERSFLAKADAVLQPHASEYTKIGSPDGTVYLVSGCGGASGSGPLDHPLMARSIGNVIGFSVIDVSWEEVRGRFIQRDGTTTDLFALRKAADVVPPRVAVVASQSPAEVTVVFDEPVQAGGGVGGAESAVRYALDPPAAVLGATLDSDQSTVRLSTSSLEPNRAYALEVQGVADPLGHTASDRALFARVEDATLVHSTPVPRGATWRHRDGATAPPPSWTARAFDASSWATGPAGFGFADGDDATVLAGMLNVYVTVYIRTPFTVPDPELVSALRLNVAYDDGFVAYLNGTEIARANVPAGQTNTTPASGSHEAGTFALFDVSTARDLLVAGTNVLAVEGHNASLSNGDFSLHPELVLTVDGPGGPPVAVASADVRTANAPARVRFSAAGSRDGDGNPPAAVRWDFGDGTSATGAEVEHQYTEVGTYVARLVVSDAAGDEAVSELSIRVHDQGAAPRALLTGATQASAGANARFDSAGSLDPDGGNVTRHWDFGDPASGTGNFSSASRPTHRFTSEGTYTVTLVVTDDEGSNASATSQVTVGPPIGGGGGGCSIDPRGGRRSADLVLGTIVLWVALLLARQTLRRRIPVAG